MRLRNDRREMRIRNGIARNEEWSKLTPEQKIVSLDARLGKGIGAKRQREKLSQA